MSAPGKLALFPVASSDTPDTLRNVELHLAPLHATAWVPQFLKSQYRFTLLVDFPYDCIRTCYEEGGCY